MTNINIKAVVFDYGGVIELYRGGNIARIIAGIIGAPLDEFRAVYFQHNHLSNVHDLSWEEMMLRVASAFTADPELIAQVKEAIRVNVASRYLNDDLVALFPVLRRQGLKVAILSNNDSSLRQRVTVNGIASLVDEVLISAEIGHQKPSPEAFAVLFKRLGLTAGEVVFVDDAPKSLETAGEIGYLPIRFQNNEQLFADLQKQGISVV